MQARIIPEAGKDGLKAAILTIAFPVASESFVVRQALGLIRSGVDLTIIALDDSGDWSCVSAEDRTLLEPLVKTAPQASVRTKTALLSLALRAPLSRDARRRLGACLAAIADRRRDVLRLLLAPTDGFAFGRFDAVIVHFGPNGVAALYMRMAGRIDGPIATVFHGYDMSVHDVIRDNMRGYRRLFRDAERFLPISHLWKRRLEQWGAPPDRVSVVRMGVDIDDRPQPIDKPFASPLRIISVGRFVEKKGHRHAIEGVAAASTPATLDLIGFGPLEAELKGLAEQVAPGKVRFLGKVAHADVLASLTDVDLFLLPSVTAESGDMEGIPVALMEAMARNCVVIATDHSGNGELVEDGVSGFLVPERSSEAIAAIIDRVGRGEVDGAAMRTAALDKVATQFNADSIDRELVDVIRQLAASARR